MLRLEFGIGSLPTPEKATVESITNADGKPARKITVQGMSPDVLLIKSMDNQRVTFVNGEATITVPDSYFIPKEITTTETDFPVTLDMVILDNRGNEVQVPCDPFTIEIPQAQASEMNPPTDTYETSDPNLTLSFKCSPDSTIYLNGEQRTEDISSGQFSVSLPLSMGENTFDLEVRLTARQISIIWSSIVCCRPPVFPLTEPLAHEPLTLGQSWMGNLKPAQRSLLSAERES